MWIFNNKPFEPPEKNPYEGFIYLIENLQTGQFYIGKKHFWSKRMDKKKGRRVTKESDWREYYSSSDDLHRDLKRIGKENFKRTILHLCIYKKQMTYLEQKEQWARNVLFCGNSYNTNIAGKFFTGEQHIYEATEKKKGKSRK